MARTVLAALLDQRLPMSVSLSGLPGRMRTGPRWDTGIRVLDEHLLYQVVRGSAALQSGSQHWILAAPAVVVIPPGIAFRFCVHLAPPTILRLRLRVGTTRAPWSCASSVLVQKDGRRLQSHLEQLIEEASREGEAGDERRRALMLLILSDVMRTDQATRSVGQFDSRQRHELERLFEEAGSRRLHPRQLARHLALSLDYFSRCFRRTFGVAPREYLVRHRIRASCMELSDFRLGIRDVAHRSGFQDVNLYARQFRRVMGISPGRYRARHHAQGPL